MAYLITALLLLFAVVVLYFYTYKILWTKNVAAGTSQFIEIDGIKIHYTVNGSKGPGILLIHGIAANLYCWRKLTPLLADNFRVYAIDLKGFGFSDKPTGEEHYSLDSHATVVAQFIENVIKEPVIIVGNSMGGNIALQVALNFKNKVKSLVLISPAYDSKVVFFNPMKIKKLMPLFHWLANPLTAKLLIRPLYGNKKDLLDSQNIQAYLTPYLLNRESHYALLHSFSTLTDNDLKNRIENINQPTLLIWGKKDYLVKEKLSQKISEKIKSSQLQIHPTAGHHLQEEEPEWLSIQIKSFVLGNN